VWLRWADAHLDVARPHSWLVRVTVRGSLDRLRQLKRRRETYLGPWLPEPASLAPNPEDTAELRDTLAVGMLLVLESLSPLERAVFVLREAFAWDNADIAEALNRSPAAVRQLAHRARQHVDQAGPRFPADDRQASESTERFLQACLDRNVEELLRVLSPTVVMLSDGGGEVRAARRALVGAQEVLTFLAGLDRKDVFGDATFTLGQVNMHPGIITSTGGRVLSAMTFDYDKSGRIAASYVVLAPSKLTHVSTAADRGVRKGRCTPQDVALLRRVPTSRGPATAFNVTAQGLVASILRGR
jgi:DNA-directed RNA polymerase specialized sigma24 family protein